MHAFIEFCRRRLFVVLAALMVLTAAAGGLASKLTLDSNLTRLLPENAPSVRGLDELERVYGGQIGRLSVVLDGADRPTLEALADDLEDDLGRLDGVRRVEVKKPVGFFKNFRLLYAGYADLEEAKARLDKRIRWEKKRANPLFVSLGDDDPPEVDFSDLTDRYGDLDQSSYYVGEEGTTLALFVYPSFPSTDLERTRSLTSRVRDSVAAKVGALDGVEFGLTGRYQKRVDLQNVLQSDLGVATSVALTLLALVLLLLLRSPSGMVVVGLPLVAGTIWSMAWAQLTFGSLNILTGFLAAVLMGIGVDYGIHLYIRYQELRDSLPTGEALAQTFATSGRANFYGGFTTAVALASLIVTDFRAFFEFGVISLGGIALILLAYALFMPPLVYLFERKGRRFRAPASLLLTRYLSGRLGHDAIQTLPRAARSAAIALGVLVLAAGVGITQLDFERSFAPLENRSSASWKLDQKINKLLGQSQTPTVVLTDSTEQSDAVIAELERRRDEDPGGETIDKVIALHSLLPGRQSDKLALLEEVLDDLRDVPAKKRSEELAGFVDEIEGLLERGPLTADKLPVGVREPFRSKVDDKQVVLVFPAIDLAEIDQVSRFAGALADLPGIDEPGRYDAISEALLLYDIVRLVERDAAWMIGLTLTGLLLISVLAFRRRREVLLQMGILVASFTGALGLAGWLGIDLNFLNIIILPIWLGLGIDASFHVLMHLREHPDDLSAQLTTAAAIAGAFITSMVGFGAMLLAHHEGLFSLGAIAVIGLGTILVVNLLSHLVLLKDAGRGAS
ncbi:hypothetical protein FIV42_10840 [Persicimonas caeni]|uniref:Membrane transport protein MMPL domain-containing protein n=1 Tax=Persicimonas caeni TaxID=2292766 RepID=A0A4Y6PSD8_PERCE|nr:MMPL family transporter [Persicimonas caeni]QDG51218.1 hypothetical protein FIV42_10840 [Persicimonas caeni]QED32439.1 MMPL family transporter [Persicimonas caeni]